MSFCLLNDRLGNYILLLKKHLLVNSSMLGFSTIYSVMMFADLLISKSFCNLIAIVRWSFSYSKDIHIHFWLGMQIFTNLGKRMTEHLWKIYMVVKVSTLALSSCHLMILIQ